MNTYRILFLGDVVGKPGRLAVSAGLPVLRKELDPTFIIINGENSAAGVGITPEIADEFYRLGADAITLGNHAFNKKDINDYLDKEMPIVRPANMPSGVPGKGSVTIRKDGINLMVSNVCGRVFLDGYDDPFACVERLLDGKGDAHFFLDFHAEATSEKIAMDYHCDGRAAAVVGTHTHVTTADETILENGTAYITDVGMCGPVRSVLGMDRDIILKKFRTCMPARFEVAQEPGVISAVVIDVLREEGLATNISRVKWSHDS